MDSLVDGSSSEEEARGPKLNHGSVAGPVANRIAGGTADIDGMTYDFERNEGGITTLHSGSKSLRDAVWEIDALSDNCATLSILRRHLEDDLPGERRFTAVYAVGDDSFSLTFEATTDRPTLVNLALHPYWTLAAGGRDTLRIRVNASSYLPVNEQKIPTGEIAAVEGKFDLRDAKRPSPEIDHNFCLTAPAYEGPAVSLFSATLTLEIETDAPGVQVFTGKPFGIAIEPQHWPDAPHHSNFPSILLRPGETYRQTTRYRFQRVE